jgi:uncharacterized protein (DUF1697 family)
MRSDYSARMPKHAAFLRGVNLGRQRRVSGAELRSQFEAMGFLDVATFRTSGNVAFGSGGETPTRMAARIETGLAQSLGYEVVIFLRTAKELRAIAAQEPFASKLLDASRGKLQVTMLAAKPPARVRNEVLALRTEDDKLAFGDRELYWLPSAGTLDSALDRSAIERLLGPTTTRTKGTLDLFTAKHFAARSQAGADLGGDG